jgi:hypothetical protein
MNKKNFIFFPLLTIFLIGIISASYPNITIISPNNNLYTIGESVSLNFSVTSDATSCWYSLNNGATNTTLTGCSNTTFETTSEGLKYLTLWAINGTNLSYDKNAFYVDNSSPVIINRSYNIDGTIYINNSIYDFTKTYSFINYNNSLKAWITMDDDSGGKPIDKVSDVVGFIGGNAVISSSGKYGDSISLDGSGDILNLDLPNLNIAPKDFTVSAWVNPVINTGSWRVILEYGRNTTNPYVGSYNWFGMWFSNTGKLHTRVGGKTMDSDLTIPLNTWTLVTLAFNTTTNTTTQYINGVYHKNASFTTMRSASPKDLIEGWESPTTYTNLTIGNSHGTTEFFNGRIDDILIFDRLLSPAEISKLYEIKSLSRDEYYDKTYGAWLGQIAGNFLGRETELDYTTNPNPATTMYYSPYSTLITGTCDPLNYWECRVNSLTDDDTSLEFLYLWGFENHGADITNQELEDLWLDGIDNTNLLYFSNKMAYLLMNNSRVPMNTTMIGTWSDWTFQPSGESCPAEGCTPPYSGAEDFNPYFDYIDAQITSESQGLYFPGMFDATNETAWKIASITNDGYARDYAVFYSLLYSEVMFTDNMTIALQNVKAYFPATSRVHNIYGNVSNWSSYYADWRDTRTEIKNLYYTAEEAAYGDGRSLFAIHSSVNFASTLMALMYGKGDFNTTIQIAGLAGWDNDCNAPSSAGAVGAMFGARNIPMNWKVPIRNFYDNTYINVAEIGDDYLTNIANRSVNVGEQFMEDYGQDSQYSGDMLIYGIVNRNKDLNYISLPKPSEEVLFTIYAVDENGFETSEEGTTEIEEYTEEQTEPIIPCSNNTKAGYTLIMIFSSILLIGGVMYFGYQGYVNGTITIKELIALFIMISIAIVLWSAVGQIAGSNCGSIG